MASFDQNKPLRFSMSQAATTSTCYRLLIVAATLLLAGCTPTTLVVPIRYLPQTNVQPIPGAESASLAVQVKDLRSNQADIGTDALPLRTYEVTTNDNLAEAVRSAIQIELQDRGFKIGTGSAALLIQINGMDSERRIGWFYENSARTVFMMQVQVARKNGKIIYTHEAVGERGESYIEAHYSVGAAERVTNLAIQDCIQRLFTDPKFIDALLNANKP